MKYLLDTQALILAGNNRLPKLAKVAYADSDNEVFFSVASLWEIGIKVSLKKLKFERTISEYRNLLVKRAGLKELPIDSDHIDRAVMLPFHHRDPFDRLLIGQAIAEGLSVISGDEAFDKYDCQRIWN